MTSIITLENMRLDDDDIAFLIWEMQRRGEQNHKWANEASEMGDEEEARGYFKTSEKFARLSLQINIANKRRLESKER